MPDLVGNINLSSIFDLIIWLAGKFAWFNGQYCGISGRKVRIFIIRANLPDLSVNI